ncbi:MAG TPA: hypothetical protein VGP26_23080 [Actinophytocola sp.]|jgi:hypothetical protein|nr:hypothetical protein [Actinophytocola sp.]
MNAPVLKEPSLPVLTPRSRPAPGWLRDLMTARAHYEERFGWPVAVQISERRLAVGLGTMLDALTMPAALGAQVHAQLGIAMLAGPVVGHAHGGEWTFLTQPLAPMSPTFMANLVTHGVRYASAGAYTVIPSTPGDKDWQWVNEPRRNQLPPSPFAVAATVRRVCEATAAH